MNEKLIPEKTDTMLEELKRITDPQTVGEAVKVIKAHFDKRFDALELKLEKRERDWGKKLHRLLAWLASQFLE